MIAIALLIIGIIGFTRRRLSVSSTRELRGGALYTVATLCCLPLPMAFVSGVIAHSSASRGKPIDDQTYMWMSLALTWGPVVVAFVLAFTLAKPKLPPATAALQGFEVKI